MLLILNTVYGLGIEMVAEAVRRTRASGYDGAIYYCVDGHLANRTSSAGVKAANEACNHVYTGEYLIKIPVRVRTVENALQGERFKKNRRGKRGQLMKFKPDTLARVHEQMALVKAQSTAGFFTNYFRQEMVGPQIFSAATARSVLLANDEHDFFRLYFFTTDLADLEQTLRDVNLPGDVVAGYLTKAADKAADENIAAAFQQSGFNPIATYRRMITYRLPPQQPNPALEYAIAADVDQLYEGLFQTFNKYTDHLPTKNRLHGYVVNRWVIVNRQAGRILGAVCFQLDGPRVNYNYLYNLNRNALDFLRLQNNFYGVMHQRGIRAGFLWINQSNTRLSALHESMGWRFDGLQDYFYLRSPQKFENFAPPFP